MSAFFYHLFRKLSREDYRRILALLEKEAGEPKAGESGGKIQIG